MKKTNIRDFLIVLGIYWLSMWAVIPVAIIHSNLTSGCTYYDDLGVLLMRINSAIPSILVAFGAGLLLTYVLESRFKKYWLWVLALLYGVLHYLGYHWVQQPRMIDRLSQVVSSLLPAIACLLGGIMRMKLLPKRGKETHP